LQGRPDGEVQPGGLGLRFIRTIMDEVEYEPCGDHNCLRLVKYLAPNKPAGSS
jgi:anti-sigma regulatory factor (Ser/Thr protein kinase)